MIPSIITLIVGSLQTNCYLVSINNQTYIIDPGDEGDFISQTIIDNNLNPKAILLTHSHFDHCLGILPLKLNFDLPIYLHPKDFFLYKQANKSSLHWTGSPGDPLPPSSHLQSVIGRHPGSFPFQVIQTPGHTPGSVCFYWQNHSSEVTGTGSSDGGILFTGDTLFADGVGRTDLSYSSSIDLQKSLKKLKKLPPNTQIYPGHGETTANKKLFTYP